VPKNRARAVSLLQIKDSCYLTSKISNRRREYPREGVSGGTSRSVLHRRVENPVDKL
jgi:hypothetical protein